MAQHSSRRPERLSYNYPFFRIFLSARTRTTRASHRAVMAGNRLPYAGVLHYPDTSRFTGNPACSAAPEACIDVHAGGQSLATAAFGHDTGGDLSIRSTRRFR